MKTHTTTSGEGTVSKRIMFGKYAGKLWSEVPTEYLEWFVSCAYPQMRNRIARAKEELSKRSNIKFGYKVFEDRRTPINP